MSDFGDRVEAAARALWKATFEDEVLPASWDEAEQVERDNCRTLTEDALEAARVPELLAERDRLRAQVMFFVCDVAALHGSHHPVDVDLADCDYMQCRRACGIGLIATAIVLAFGWWPSDAVLRILLFAQIAVWMAATFSACSFVPKSESETPQ